MKKLIEAMGTAFATLLGIGFIAVVLALQCMIAVVPIGIGLWLWKIVF